MILLEHMMVEMLFITDIYDRLSLLFENLIFNGGRWYLAKNDSKAAVFSCYGELNAPNGKDCGGKPQRPDCVNVRIARIIDRPESWAKSFMLSSEDGSALPPFRAGQYISIRLKIGESLITRPYSLCSSPRRACQGEYEVTVSENPGGFAADWMLRNLKVGDKLVVSAPLGEFFHDEARDCHDVIALAGGSGITPFLSMAAAIRDGDEDFRLTIIDGNRNQRSIMFREELDEICAATDKVRVIHVLSDENKEGFEHGLVTAELIRKHAKGDYSIFICGPGAMYSFLKSEMAKLDLPKHLVRSESPAVTHDIARRPRFPAEAAGRNFKITVRQGVHERLIEASSEEPVLIALERAGIKAPSSCRSGVCGWCRSRLVSGECFAPEENDGRSPEELRDGYIHPCASFPVSDIVLEVPDGLW